MSKWLDNLFNTLVLLALTTGIVHLASSVSYSADTHTVPQTAEVTLAWDPNDPTPDGYCIYQRTEGQSYDYTQPCWTGSGTSGKVYNLEWDTTYYFVVRAYAGTQESADSEEVSFVSPPPEPASYPIVATIAGHGTISPIGVVEVARESDKTYVVMPDTGYHVADVVVDGVSMGAINTYTFDQIDSDRTIHAVFAADQVAIVDSTDDNGIVLPAGTDFMRAMEFSDVQINHTWIRIDFEKTFINPVVVAGPISLNGGQPAVVRIQNVDAAGFEMRLQEWDYLDGSHMIETVSYLVMEQGNYILDDGTKIEAGNIETSAAASFKQISFNDHFNVAPVVMTTITSFNDSDALTGRMRRITIDGFQYRMQEQESNAQNHGAEKLSYIAWEPSSGEVGEVAYLIEKTVNVVKQENYCIFFDDPFTSAPTFLADMQTTDGGDTANVRYANKDEFAVDVLIDEEQSRDTETGHTTEVVGYMAFGRNRTDISEAMEFGDVQIDHHWTRINFEKTFVKPIVVAGPISLNGGQPAVIRIQNVDATGFDMRIQEWDYLDGSHVTETVNYLVVEQGNYTLDDGTKIEAANIETGAADSFLQFGFIEAFNVPPIVMTTVTSFNDSDAVTGRMRQVTIDGFRYRMQEQGGNVQDHGTETLSYIAWEPSSGAVGDTTYLVEKTLDAVTHNNYTISFEKPFSSSPTFLSDMQTADGGDTANIRCNNNDGFSVDILIDEEQALDTEVDHTTEVVGYMVFFR